MSDELQCYRCGAGLEALTLPLARLDECPACGVQLHVCRMCVHFAPGRPEDCDEEDALEVRDKRSANFCDYFVPSTKAYSPGEQQADAAARERLASLFGEAAAQTPRTSEPPTDTAQSSASGQTPSAGEAARRAAEDLFKK